MNEEDKNREDFVKPTIDIKIVINNYFRKKCPVRRCCEFKSDWEIEKK